MTRPRERIRNFGFVAHVDSGKTTLGERVLFYAGKIRRMVDVKDGSGRGPALSTLDLEVEKGITIRAAATTCEWRDHQLTIIDTPGHVDFTIEVERALRVLDGAVLVLCGVGGVQPQTITVDRQLRRWRVPRLAFVNKCDRPGADPLRVCDQLRQELGLHAALVQYPIGLESGFTGVVELVERIAWTFEGEQGERPVRGDVPRELVDVVERQRRRLVEALAEVDDDLAAAWLERGDDSAAAVHAAIRRATLARSFVPVLLGSAGRNKGVQPLLDGVVRWLPSPLDARHEGLAPDGAAVTLRPDPAAPLVALAFKLHVGRSGQLTHLRLYQGRLARGDVVTCSAGRSRRVTRLVRMHSDAMEDIAACEAGDVVAALGLDCATGETVSDGTVDLTMTPLHVPEPVVSLQVSALREEQAPALAAALDRFAREDPTLRVEHDEQGRLVVAGLGELQLEVYLERVRREAGVAVVAEAPRVAYRETITRKAAFACTRRKQGGGPGEYARIAGRLEPAESNGFVDATTGGVLPRELSRAVDAGFRDGLRSGGLIGAPVVGVRMVVDDADTHPVDSKEAAFQAVGRQALREAYPRARPVVLEPIMRVTVEAPAAQQGAVLGGLGRRRGVVQATGAAPGERVVLTALVPLRELFGYGTDLRSQTQGKADLSIERARLAPVPPDVQERLVAERA